MPRDDPASPSPVDPHPGGSVLRGASLLWNLLQTLAACGLVLGILLVWIQGWSGSLDIDDSGYVSGFLLLLMFALLLVIGPTALWHAQTLRHRGTRPAGLVRGLFVANAVCTAFVYLVLGLIVVRLIVR